VRHFFVPAIQPNLPSIATLSPDEKVRENLERVMFRLDGDIRSFYDDLLEKIPEPPQSPSVSDLEKVAKFRQLVVA